LELVGHSIKLLGDFSDFIRGLHLDPMVKVASFQLPRAIL